MMGDSLGAPPRPNRLLEGVQYEVRPHVLRNAPAHHLAGKHIQNKSNINNTLPAWDVGKIGHPKLVRVLRAKLRVARQLPWPIGDNYLGRFCNG